MLPAWCTRCSAWCNVSPVHTQIMVALHGAQKWAVGAEYTSWVMLFVCIGGTLFQGIAFGGLSIMNACI